MKATSFTTGNVSVLYGLQAQSSLNRHAVMTLEQLSDQDRYHVHQRKGSSGLRDLIPSSLVVKPQDLKPARHHSLSPTKVAKVIKADLIPSSLVVKPQDLNPPRHHSLSPTKMRRKIKTFDETLYSPSSRFALKGQYAQLAYNREDVVGTVKNLPDQEVCRVPLVQELSVMPVALDVRPQNLVPSSREMSSPRKPKQTERRSLLQSGRKDSRSKLSTTRKPDLLRASSMSNVMARTGKQMGQQNLLKDFQKPDIMLTPAKKSTSQRSLHGVSERTSKSDSELLKRRSNNERASSVLDVNQKSPRALVTEKKQTSERTLLKASRKSSKAESIDDAETLPKQLVKPGTKVRLQGLNANPALKGQTVTIAKFLSDDNRNRVKPLNVEATDAASTKAVSNLPVQKRIAPMAAHTTRHPVMPQKSSSQRSVLQNRKSAPCSDNVTPTTPSRALSSKAKIPAYQTPTNECFFGVTTACPYLLEDEFPGVSR
jgi:hypothetical protein